VASLAVRPDLGPGSAALHRAPLPGARPGLIEVEQTAVGCGAAGATLHDVVRWTIAIVEGHPPAEGFAAFGEAWGNAGDAPAISVHIVSGLASPQYLVEVDAVAVI
jgi:enamine deaminase RidA (YjgF/YER057c/UK114 family)